MDRIDSVVAVFGDHDSAEAAVKKLAASGFEMKNISLVGKGYHTDEKVVGFYNMGDRIKFWGTRGAFWGVRPSGSHSIHAMLRAVIRGSSAPFKPLAHDDDGHRSGAPSKLEWWRQVSDKCRGENR